MSRQTIGILVLFLLSLSSSILQIVLPREFVAYRKYISYQALVSYKHAKHPFYGVISQNCARNLISTFLLRVENVWELTSGYLVRNYWHVSRGSITPSMIWLILLSKTCIVGKQRLQQYVKKQYRNDGAMGQHTFDFHQKSMENWVGTKNLVFFTGYNAATLYWNLQKRSLYCR